MIKFVLKEESPPPPPHADISGIAFSGNKCYAYKNIHIQWEHINNYVIQVQYMSN